MSALESVISKGGKVAEKDVLNLIEMLMNQLLKLDGIMADGDVKLQRKMQVSLSRRDYISCFYVFGLFIRISCRACNSFTFLMVV